jgi:hypothetical protein
MLIRLWASALDLGMSVARCAAALGLLVVLGGGCGKPGECGFLPYSSPPPTSAIFDLSCVATDLVTVALSGVCATGDASPSNYLSGQSVEISSQTPGVCHVELMFATGFTYSTEVEFTSKTWPIEYCNGSGSESYIGPTQVTFSVNNPSTTCVDAGIDAMADTPTDASSETAVDAQADAGADG